MAVVAEPAENSFAFWRSLASHDPAIAARTVVARIAGQSADARRATWAIVADETQLVAEFMRGVGTRGPLAGVPFAVKDLFFVAGWKTGAGSTFLGDMRGVDATDAPLVAALRDAGAVCVGKTHLHEFAYGLTGENPHFGDCPNPRWPRRLTGGSSSGSAAAVAAGIVPLALGTDTGGSVRVPAAFCGLWGYRGRPRDRWIEACFPLAESFDTAGWFTNDAAELAEVLTLVHGPTPERSAKHGFVSLPARDLAPEIDDAIADALDRAAARISQPMSELLRRDFLAAVAGAVDAHVVLQGRDAALVHAPWLDAHRNDYDPLVWQRLDRARQRTDVEIARAEAKRTEVRETIARILQHCAGLVLPASPFPALRKEESTEENRTRLLRLTTPASLAGAPAATLPVRLADGTTSGLQIVLPAYHPAALAESLHELAGTPGL